MTEILIEKACNIVGATVVTRVFLFAGFPTSQETENFQKFSREIPGFPKILRISGIRDPILHVFNVVLTN